MPEPSYPSISWITRAERMDDGVSESSPVRAWVNRHDPPEPLQIDIHPAIEMGVVLEGQHVRHFPDLVVTLNPGEVWLCAAWEPHGFQPAPCGGILLVMTFLPQVLSEAPFEGVSWLSMFAVPPAERPQSNTPEMREKVLVIARELRQEVERELPYWVTGVRLGIFRLLLLLTRCWEARSPEHLRPKVHPNDLSRIMPALSLFYAGPTRTVRLSEAAAACGLSMQRFSAIFRKTMGTSFAKFHLRARLATAAHRLLTSELPVAAIASETGFLDASHLHRTFVKHYLCTPARYRQQSRILQSV